MGDAAVRERRAAGQIRHVLDMGRAHDPLIVFRDVRTEPVQRDVLLGVRPDEVVIRHARDREDRLAIERRVVETVQQVDAARTRGCQADAEPAREFRVAARHQRRGLFVAHLDEPYPLAPLAQRFHDSVDPVARKPKDDLDTPVVDRLDQHVGRRQCHLISPAPCVMSAQSRGST